MQCVQFQADELRDKWNEPPKQVRPRAADSIRAADSFSRLNLLGAGRLIERQELPATVVDLH
jgi:hypothetical protein